jgi:exodeoxyribonuclease VII large subunit
MIVGRGGGSMEYLWAFNEEIVARAVFECNVPIISAVGHETDTTIIDYVADMRAPTPSAAAELAVYEYSKLKMTLQEYEMKLKREMLRKIQFQKLRYDKYRTKFQYLSPEQYIRDYRQKLIDIEEKLQRGIHSAIKEKRITFSLYIERLKGLSPLEKLNQGFSYVTTSEEKTVKSIQDVAIGDALKVFVTDGYIEAEVVKTAKEDFHGES